MELAAALTVYEEPMAAEITDLLRLVEAGDTKASGQLFENVYARLKGMARNRLGGRGLVELDATSLVHETYMRLVERRQRQLKDRAAFYGYVGRVMRSVVIDYVRAQQALKRGGEVHMLTLATGVAGETPEDAQLLALNVALEKLEDIAPQFRSLLDMRYFAGLSVREIADIRGISTRTVEREWEKARAFLRALMQQ